MLQRKCKRYITIQYNSLRVFECSQTTTFMSLQMKSDIQQQTGVGSISLADLALKAEYRGAI